MNKTYNSRSVSSDNHVSYDSTEFHVGPGVNMDDLKMTEDWEDRPASEWSVQRIGILESKIEAFTYQIFRSNKYGKHNLSKVIPKFKLVEFANEAFGHDGWSIDVLDVQITESTITPNQSTENFEMMLTDDEHIMHNVIAEAKVKVTLKDGTNTQVGGIGRAVLPSKAMSFAKAKKEAISDALKKAILGFENIIMEYNRKVQSNYYVDGLYVSKIKQESYNPLGVTLNDPKL
ncbi:similar to Saccharomyces cerevisiae YDL059C RAD59 Protein involved in the repair of double-strand breaks in DNA during vegetative growth via recombination and single-strand annealing [Maudiozyma saulgeensis]|uniref:DNA repair protein RAD59 n=1 Tax=Maudiozyma saulgeensis TaxID=1789683 RepID=A0A1X7QZM4_9SACH|nr:similar to Saccharomyces cerevisiae YDL059C RAD59 Protein involved in the repair of double-strand breaks in DNA during vegetative growth via recombination and single-strand annealing [Kazachstania saulgeensis]